MKDTARKFLILSLMFCALSIEIAAQTCARAPVGLVSWWAADGTALDSRSRNNGTLLGGTTFAAGQNGQAFSFDGVNDFVNVPDSASLDSWTTTATFEAWINPQLQPSSLEGYIFARRNPNLSEGFSVSVQNSGGGLIINIYLHTSTGTDGFFTPIALTFNQWQHVAVTVNLATNSKQIFVNGQPQTLTTFIGDGNLSGQLFQVESLFFGQRQANLNFYKGAIDELSFYTTELSQSQIQAIVAAGTAGKCKPTATAAPSGQVGWWSGDGNTNDLAGANNGTPQNGAGFTVGKVGQSFDFDGANDFIGLGDPPSLKFTNTNFSVEGWFMIPDVPNNPGTQCGARYPIFGYDFGYTVEVGGDGRLRFRKFVDQNNGVSLDSLSAISTNTFHHFTAVHTPTEMRLYLNGTLVNTLPITNGNLFYPANDFPEIGRFTCGVNDFYFKGKIDELSIYNRAISASEIASIFNAGLAGKLKQTTTTGTTATVGDATVSYPNSSARTTQEIPLDPAVLPALPVGFTATGLFYDVAASAVFTGNPSACFNLPSFTQAQFPDLRILHLENGVWVNRAAALNIYPNLCSDGLTSLSPFAIVQGADPTPTPTPMSTPTITTAGGVTRQQAAGASNSSIAVVNDIEDAESALSVTVNGSSSATENGVTVSNIAVDAAGNVTADVSAACGAIGAAFTLRVTDSGGLFAEATLNVAVTNETTPPVIDPISNVVVMLPLNSLATSTAVTFPTPTATDNCSAPTVTTDPVSGMVFNVGATTVNVTATDGNGNTATSSFTVTVLYNFAGFFQPVDNLPTVNVVNAGQSIPVKFSLSGNKGLNIFAIDYPASGAIPCEANEPGDVIEETATPGASTLTYDAATDRYSYVWRTDRSWKETCRILVVRLNDGSDHFAKFRFR